jgi:hypothetical protein
MHDGAAVWVQLESVARLGNQAPATAAAAAAAT